MSVENGDGPKPAVFERALLEAIEQAEASHHTDIAASLRIILEYWRRKQLPNGNYPAALD